jgi:hypothetical protein
VLTYPDLTRLTLTYVASAKYHTPCSTTYWNAANMNHYFYDDLIDLLHDNLLLALYFWV